MRPLVRMLVMFLPRILREVQRYMKKRERAPKREKEVYHEDNHREDDYHEYNEEPQVEPKQTYSEDELVP